MKVKAAAPYIYLRCVTEGRLQFSNREVIFNHHWRNSHFLATASKQDILWHPTTQCDDWDGGMRWWFSRGCKKKPKVHLLPFFVQSIRKNKRDWHHQRVTTESGDLESMRKPAPPRHCVNSRGSLEGGRDLSSHSIRDSRKPAVNRGRENGAERRLLRGDKLVFCLEKWSITVKSNPGLTLLVLTHVVTSSCGTAGISERCSSRERKIPPNQLH